MRILNKKPQCIPETAIIWLNPTSEKSFSACFERLARLPVKRADKKAAESPSK
jgi:hypothetical protein